MCVCVAEVLLLSYRIIQVCQARCHPIEPVASGSVCFFCRRVLRSCPSVSHKQSHRSLVLLYIAVCLSLFMLKCNVEQLTLIQPLGIIKSSSNIKPNPATCHRPLCLPRHVRGIDCGSPLSLKKNTNVSPLALHFIPLAGSYIPRPSTGQPLYWLPRLQPTSAPLLSKHSPSPGCASHRCWTSPNLPSRSSSG